MHFLEHEGKPVLPLWINGEDKPVNPNYLIEVTNSAENKIVHYAQGATVEDATSAVETAQASFPGWSSMPVSARRDILLKASELLADRAGEFAIMERKETSSPPGWGEMMGMYGSQMMREFACQITTALTGMLPYSEENTVITTRHAIGPVLIICPWNNPMCLAPRSIGAALTAGCTVVFKASEICPATYRLICQAFVDAGLPTGVLNQISARREDAVSVIEAIISHPAIRKVDFIGSDTVRRSVAQMCGKYLKPISLELGDKGPAIICEDANLELAA